MNSTKKVFPPQALKTWLNLAEPDKQTTDVELFLVVMNFY